MLLVREVKCILLFLTKNGFVNHGILHDVPRNLTTIPKDKEVCLLLTAVFFFQINPLSPSIHIQTLQTDLHIFP